MHPGWKQIELDAGRQELMVAKACRSPGKGALSDAGRALSKHPHIVGVFVEGNRVTQALHRKFGGDSGVDAAAANAMRHLLAEGTAWLRPHPQRGLVIDVLLPDGSGVRFLADSNEFDTFLGRPD